MSKTFIIGDREKNEWISVFSENEKTMAFCNEMSKAKTFATPNEAKEELEQMQKTGYFTDLSVYLLERLWTGLKPMRRLQTWQAAELSLSLMTENIMPTAQN